MIEHQERRIKEKCICGGQVFAWRNNNKLMKACVICGIEIEAKRDSDKTNFHAEADKWHN